MTWLTDAPETPRADGDPTAETILMAEDNAEVSRLKPGTPVLLTTGWADRIRDHEDSRPDTEMIAKSYRRTDLVRKLRRLPDRDTVGA